jgi:tRNA(fMet)-specific endonuclease VapC
VIVLLDTNVFVTLMRDPMQFRRLNVMLESGRWSTVYMSAVTLFELEMGVLGRQREASARARLSAILAGPIQVIGFDESAARSGALIAAKARANGRQLSAIDALIAGHANILFATLVTDDARLAAAVGEVAAVSWR